MRRFWGRKGTPCQPGRTAAAGPPPGGLGQHIPGSPGFSWRHLPETPRSSGGCCGLRSQGLVRLLPTAGVAGPASMATVPREFPPARQQPMAAGVTRQPEASETPALIGRPLLLSLQPQCGGRTRVVRVLQTLLWERRVGRRCAALRCQGR